MKNIKKLSLISLVLVLAMALTACQSEVSLLKAMKKQQEITSIKAQTKYSFDVETKDLTEENQLVFDMIKDTLNDLEVTLDQKSIQTKEKDKVYGKLYFTVRNKEKVDKATIWVDVDVKDKEEPKILEIFEFPMEKLGNEFEGKKYVKYDMSKIEELMSKEEKDLNEKMIGQITKWAYNSEPKFEKISLDLLKSIKLEDGIIKNLGEKDGLKQIQIKMNDKQFKKFVKEAFNKLIDNKEFREVYGEYIDLIVKLSELEEQQQKELIKVKDFEKIKELFNSLMEKVEEVPVLGEKGFNTVVAINKDGYIVKEEGSLNLVIDFAKISKAMKVEEKIDKGTVDLTINFNTDISQINDTSIVADYPELTEENTIDLIEVMKEQMESSKEEVE